MKIQNSKKLLEVADMPELTHHVGKLAGETYDVMRSECVAWLWEQPGVREWLWSHVAQSGLIVYDKGAGTWKGVGKNIAEEMTRGVADRRWKPEMLAEFLKAAGRNGVNNQNMVKEMMQQGMSYATYYRVRSLAEAQKLIWMDQSSGTWKHTDFKGSALPNVPRGIESGDTSSNTNKDGQVSQVSGEIKLNPKRAKLTDSEMELLKEACSVPNHPGDIDANAAEKWMRENILGKVQIGVEQYKSLLIGEYEVRGIGQLIPPLDRWAFVPKPLPCPPDQEVPVPEGSVPGAQ